MARETPMMKQWAELKATVPDGIILFRLGDFYEAFNEDAEVLARVCEVTLTSRPVAKGARAPMAGVPYHAVDGYIAQLVRAGVKVALVEQQGAESSPEKRARMSGPPREGAAPAAPAGKILAREIVRVVTPGTLLEGDLIEAGAGHYLAALAPALRPGGAMGLAVLDLSTGEFLACELDGPLPDRLLWDELTRLRPAELILPDDEAGAALAEALEARRTLLGLGTLVARAPAARFAAERARRTLLEHFAVRTLGGFGLDEAGRAAAAAGAALAYAAESQRGALGQVASLATWRPDGALTLDAATRRSLELVVTLRGETRGTLLAVLDRTRTAMGARRLRAWLDAPLRDAARIAARADAVAWLAAGEALRAALRAALKGTPDLERLVGRVVAGYAGPRELLSLAAGLEAVPRARRVLEGASDGALPARVAQLARAEVAPLAARIRATLVEEPPAAPGAPGVIRPGVDAALDEVHAGVAEARAWIAALEGRAREETGIARLKVGYNRVFGYYLQVPKAAAGRVPADWTRKQTIAGGERYVTPALKAREAEVERAESRIVERERAILGALMAAIVAEAPAASRAARDLGDLDALASLAEVAVDGRYARPEIVDEPILEIRGGRHPVIERQRLETTFVPNDLTLAPGEIAILTGPNMAGKSTVGRQAALIVILAQMGAFVPADAARVGLTDRILTRIGAWDELAAGQSTFMVEMVETASILRHATPRSLVVLDELGRGTSTYDGIAIAWAVVEHLAARAPHGPRTLFATNYHELTALAERLAGVTNLSMAVADEGGRVAFLHRVVPGAADRSYGVHVAELAGVPRAVTARAWEILARLEAEGGAPLQAGANRPGGDGQLALFAPAPAPPVEPLVSEIAALDLDELSPRAALETLYELRRRARERLE